MTGRAAQGGYGGLGWNVLPYARKVSGQFRYMGGKVPTKRHRPKRLSSDSVATSSPEKQSTPGRSRIVLRARCGK